MQFQTSGPQPPKSSAPFKAWWSHTQSQTATNIATTATNQNTGGSQGHTHGLNLKRLNMYGWIRTT